MIAGRRVLVILNPASGKGEAAAASDAVQEAVAEAGAADCQLRWTERRQDAVDWAAAAAEEGFDLLMAGGGDGTVAAVAEGRLRAGSELPIGILPLGTGNGLARVLGIPLQPQAAVRTMAEGRAVPVDVVEVLSHGAFSLLYFGAGLDARIIRDAKGEEKAKMGFLAYLKAALLNLRGTRDHDLDLQLDGRRFAGMRGHTVSVFNATRIHMLGMPVGPDAQPHDGLMDVVVLRSAGFWRDAGKLLRLINRVASQLELEPAKRLRLEASPPLPVHVDGDLVGRTPLEAVLRPAALQLLAAAGYQDDRREAWSALTGGGRQPADGPDQDPPQAR